MKQLKLFSAMGIVCLLLFSSCAADEETSTETATVDTAAVAPESAVNTNPETILVVWHKVRDFAKWKTSFEAHDSMKLAFGIHNYVLGRSVQDSNLIMVAVKADDVEKAKAFIKDPSLKKAMQDGGVIGAPNISINTVVYQDGSANMSDLRSMTNFTVKDWDAWKSSFESYRQLRNDNGVTDRAYGYDVDDNHKVVLVVGINDTTKAEAFWNGNLIKEKRAESGVVGEVKRNIYRVVHKY